jgi:predicted patatin/cPLA2 family phospholipase
MHHGSNPQLAIANILRRSEQRRNGTADSDGRKLGLVIEGGGMRSVYSGAGAVALAQLGFSDVFDEVYATSAGVMNASYFITNQPWLGMSEYFDNCPTRTFMNPWRFWKILNVDYIVDQVATVEKPLNVGSLLASRTHLLVSACDSQTGELILIDTRTTKAPLSQVLRAAMAIPVLYNRTVEVEGRQLIDSGTTLPFPLAQAIERGCTDVLVLLTRPVSFREHRPTWIMRRMFDLVHRCGGTELSRAFARRHEMSQSVRDLALGRIAAPSGVNIVAVCPDDTDDVESTSTNYKLTYPAAIRYGRKTLQLFGSDPEELILTLHH